MKVYRNTKEIKKKEQIGRRFSMTALGVIFAGMIISFVPTFFPAEAPPTDPWGAFFYTWSPILKKYLVIASVHRGYEAKGTRLLLEHTVEFERRKVAATVVATPFYDPERKRKP